MMRIKQSNQDKLKNTLDEFISNIAMQISSFKEAHIKEKITKLNITDYSKLSIQIRPHEQSETLTYEGIPVITFYLNKIDPYTGKGIMVEDKICTCSCHKKGRNLRHIRACCDLTYLKYINEDGSFDWEEYKILIK